jgi:hypothetical protein
VLGAIATVVTVIIIWAPRALAKYASQKRGFSSGSKRGHDPAVLSDDDAGVTLAPQGPSKNIGNRNSRPSQAPFSAQEETPNTDLHTPLASQRPPQRDLVYISYSHRDKQWHSKLREVLDKDDRLPVWDDTKIPAGADFETEIREHVLRARIMVMLVSPDYVSPNCGAAELEIKPALEAAKKGEVSILWIPVRPSAVFQHPIGKLLAAHDPARPLEALDPAAQQKALTGVCERLYGVLGLSSRQSYQYDAQPSHRNFG